MLISGRPLGDRVLLRRVAAEKKHGSLYIPENSQEKPLEADVVAVGAGRFDEYGKLVPMSLKVGDRVLMGKYSGVEVKIDEVEHTIVREDEVLMVIEERVKRIKSA